MDEEEFIRSTKRMRRMEPPAVPPRQGLSAIGQGIRRSVSPRPMPTRGGKAVVDEEFLPNPFADEEVQCRSSFLSAKV